ncbi:L-type lectin-domain containing protein [Enterococcus rivorum]|uniref:L-type lectin-domain containing protein n=1 Tax=Enterococcus rivorum TaxID=762845 RepID=UPI000A01916B|nr:L-type lectin-domain containing protein [Enterococcus rivorum]MBP2097302.1 hypothetical protein [Enterococcus rivorum]
MGVVGNSASSQDGVAIVTNGSAKQVGAVWSTANNLLDFTKDFNTIAYVNQGDAGSASGDGMVFVIQGVSKQMKWFTYNGASLGTLGENKYNGALGIPNSIGIEFDLYGNTSAGDGYFDYGITSPHNNNHIAIVYPGTQEGYTDNWALIGSSRYVNHNNTIKDVNLSNGNWTRLELNWETNLADYTQGILTMQINNTVPVQISPQYLKSQVFQNGTVSSAYWGFTGSTGPTYKAKQQVVFEKVPGLVEAETSLSMKDLEGNLIANGAELKGYSVLRVDMKAKWLYGKQSWQSIIAKTTLPESLEVLPNTTKIDGIPIADSVWSGHTLSTKLGDIPDIGTHLGNTRTEATISVDVKVENETKSNQTIQNNFSGRNAIYETDYLGFSVEKQFVELELISHQDKTVFIDGEVDSLIFDFTWSNPSKTQIGHTLVALQDDDFRMLYEPIVEDGSAGKGIFSYDFTSVFNSFKYGKFIVSYNVQTSKEQENIERVFYKQYRPKVSLKEKNKQPSYNLGEKIPLEIDLEDKDSTEATLFVQVDNNDVQPIGKFENKTDTITQINYDLPTENLTTGYHEIKSYMIDSEGNQSLIASLKNIAIEGSLKLSSVPTNFEQKALKIGGPTVKITDFGKVAVTDQRLITRGWSLSASLVEGRFTATETKSQKKFKANKTFFFYKNGSKELPIAEGPISIFKSSGGGSLEEQVLNQDGENGFYFRPNNAMAKGNYQATVNWSLISAPE